MTKKSIYCDLCSKCVYREGVKLLPSSTGTFKLPNGYITNSFQQQEYKDVCKTCWEKISEVVTICKMPERKKEYE